MDLAKLRNITNNYQDIRLVSLRDWKGAMDYEPRDMGGPYVIYQAGFDPEDLQMNSDEFVLGRSGEWARLSVFFSLPAERRKREFVFGTAAEVMDLLHRLNATVRTMRDAKESASAAQEETDDDLNAVVIEAKRE